MAFLGFNTMLSPFDESDKAKVKNTSAKKQTNKQNKTKKQKKNNNKKQQVKVNQPSVKNCLL